MLQCKTGIFGSESPIISTHCILKDALQYSLCPMLSQTSHYFQICNDSVKSALDTDFLRRHVYRDLRPYVCTFAICQNAQKLYTSRYEWEYHETQMHRRKSEWVCPQPCGHSASSKSEMEEHLRLSHAETLSGPLAVSQFANACEREMDEDREDTCPLCPQSMSLSRLRKHLGSHLEELALFVLPSVTADDGKITPTASN